MWMLLSPAVEQVGGCSICNFAVHGTLLMEEAMIVETEGQDWIQTENGR